MLFVLKNSFRTQSFASTSFLHHVRCRLLWEEQNGFCWMKGATDLHGHEIGLENDQFHRRGASDVLWEIQKRVALGAGSGKARGLAGI